LEPLALVESGPHPQVRGARQNAFCECQDALYVEFFELARVTFVGSVAERREMPSVTERSNAATEERLKSGHAVGGVSIV
jgi:hypothetical protein